VYFSLSGCDKQEVLFIQLKQHNAKNTRRLFKSDILISSRLLLPCVLSQALKAKTFRLANKCFKSLKNRSLSHLFTNILVSSVFLRPVNK
jgi:hypothetical protein